MSPGSHRCPDLLVVSRENFDDEGRPLRPLLVVEILSPSTRTIDLELKRARYQAADCPSYWVVDLIGPSIIAWQLSGGVYGEIARVAADEPFETALPFPVRIVPRQLVN